MVRNFSKRTAAVLVPLTVATIFGQNSPSHFNASDPGIRSGSPAAGAPLTGLTAQQILLFNAAKTVFGEVDSVAGKLPGEEGSGLGPSFNMNSCSGCHAFPAIGGASPQINPQVAMATLHGAKNTVPSFIKMNGPVRVARFQKNADGSADGGVHDLFVITGRSDAPPGCQIAQTDFQSQLSKSNISFRIPTPIFGAGLIEAIPDSVILANKGANSQAKATFGISGRENRNGNDGSVTRFGWKAQNKSILIFAGEAYNVEQGVTNDVFPNARQTDPTCDTNFNAEDHTDYFTGAPSDVQQFSLFMRMLAPPSPAASYGNVNASSIETGQGLFNVAGCVLCHTETLNTGLASLTPVSNQRVRLFSDLLLHNMGSKLADGISQGVAGGDEFRTAPLWGLGQRIFLLHDGRTSDLTEAISQHSSQGSEANSSVNAFNGLGDRQQQDVLNFLRSL